MGTTIAEEMIGTRVLVRTRNAGVFAGVMVACQGQCVKLSAARRLWHWEGAASLSELAVRGTCNPGGCKFPAAVKKVLLYGWIELLECTDEGWASIMSVPEWRA